MIAVGDLLANGKAILSAVESSALTLHVTLPDRQYVTVGGSVYDCEQVTVSAISSDTGLVGAESGGMSDLDPCDPVWKCVYEVGVVRKAVEAVSGARGTILPKVADVEADTKVVSADFAVLVGAAQAMSDAGVFRRMATSVQFGQPQGGLIAAVASFTVNLWGA